MGTTHVKATIRKVDEPHEDGWTESFLVDTGAYDCLVPARELIKIGLKPRRKREYELADGSRQKFSVCAAEVEFMDEIVGVTVIFGSDDAEPILGVTALESAGYEVDPRTQRLKKLPAVRLKSLFRQRRSANSDYGE